MCWFYENCLYSIYFEGLFWYNSKFEILLEHIICFYKFRNQEVWHFYICFCTLFGSRSCCPLDLVFIQQSSFAPNKLLKVEAQRFSLVKLMLVNNVNNILVLWPSQQYHISWTKLLVEKRLLAELLVKWSSPLIRTKQIFSIGFQKVKTLFRKIVNSILLP